MPELPDITVYLEALEARILGQTLTAIRLNSPFLLRTIAPAPAEFAGRPVTALRRIGKRIAVGVEGDLWAVLHLMIGGRLHWKPVSAKLAGKNALAAFDFANGSLTLTEAGSKRRASLHLVRGETELNALDPGGLEVLTATLAQFTAALQRENHTLKRTLTDPHILSGIGNAYSDEILHRAGLSPLLLTQKLTSTQIARLHHFPGNAQPFQPPSKRPDRKMQRLANGLAKLIWQQGDLEPCRAACGDNAIQHQHGEFWRDMLHHITAKSKVSANI